LKILDCRLQIIACSIHNQLLKEHLSQIVNLKSAIFNWRSSGIYIQEVGRNTE
jgi:hypothetical protein